MSYTEYLRRKDAVAIKILSTRENTDASTHTWKVKMASSTVFFQDGSSIGVVNRPQDLKDDALKKVMSYKKATGPTPDASLVSQCFAGRALADSLRPANAKPGPTIRLEPCCIIEPTVPALSGSDFIRERLACQVANGETHDASTVTPPVFVDNTVRLSVGILPGGTGCCWPAANHEIKTKNSFPLHPERPSQAGGQYALIPAPTTTPDEARKVGAALRNIPYVEKHHGNDLNVNPKRPFRRYQIPAGSPAHLKINEPRHYPVA